MASYRGISTEDYKLLGSYIRGQLPEKEHEALEKRLRGDKQLFRVYTELKEGLFWQQQDMQPSAELKQAVQKMVEQEQSRPSYPFVRIIIRFLKDSVMVSSAGQDNLDFNGVMAKFAYRGDSHAGPITINRNINGHEVNIVLTPIPNSRRFLLAVNLADSEGVQASLKEDGEELETLQDLAQERMFRSQIQSRGKVELIFARGGEELFAVELSLESG